MGMLLLEDLAGLKARQLSSHHGPSPVRLVSQVAIRAANGKDGKGFGMFMQTPKTICPTGNGGTYLEGML